MPRFRLVTMDDHVVAEMELQDLPTAINWAGHVSAGHEGLVRYSVDRCDENGYWNEVYSADSGLD